MCAVEVDFHRNVVVWGMPCMMLHDESFKCFIHVQRQSVIILG